VATTQEHESARAAAMARGDCALLVLAQLVLIAVMVPLIRVVMALADSPAIKMLALAAGGVLVVAAGVAVGAVIVHLARNYKAINGADLAQQDLLGKGRHRDAC